MSPLWVYVEELAQEGAITLSPDEARHVAARRLRVGDAIVVFDGRGRTANARLDAIAKHTTRVSIEAIAEATRSASPFVLASAIPKGDRLSSLLQMSSQVGLEVWQPLVLDESVVRTLDPSAPRLARILIESCKLARRPFRLEVRPPCSLEEALAAVPDGVALFHGDREAGTRGIDAERAWVAIGPEAGFSDAERAALRKAGARPRSFGDHNLRIETAAVAASVAFHLRRGGNARSDGGE